MNEPLRSTPHLTLGGRVKRHRFPAEALEARIAPAANAWIGGVSGNWADPANWSDGVPTADDDVTINPAGALTISIPTGAQVANSLQMPGDDILQITGGSLTLTSTSLVSNLALSAGTLNAGPRLTLTGPGSFEGEATIAGFLRNEGTFSVAGSPNVTGTLENPGTITSTGRLDFSGLGRLDNLAGGFFNVNLLDGGSFAAGGGAVPGFFNAGTLRLNTGGTATFNAPFNNLPGGTIEVSSGTLNLAAGGTWEGANLQIAAGAVVALTSGTISWSGTFGGLGGGLFRLGGGIQGASDGGMLLIGAGGATANFPNGTFELSGNATIAGGTFLNQGVMTILDRPDLNGTILNAGTIRHFGRLDMGATSRIDNLTSGVYEIVSVLDGIVGAPATGAPGFFNSGLVRHSSTATSTFNMDFNNLSGGVIEGVAGELVFNRNGSWGNTDFVIRPGAEVTLGGGVVQWAGDFTGSGGGLLRLGRGIQGASSGGQITVGAGGATFDFPTGFFEFSGNATLDGGVVSNLGEIAFADFPNFGATIDNSGKLVVRGRIDFLATGRINNLVDGVLEIAPVGGGTVTSGASTVPGIFNAGTIRGTEAGVSAITIPFSNLSGGIIEVTAGTLALHSAGVWEGGNFLVNTGSEVTLNAGSKIWTGNYSGTGGGVVRLGGGTQGASAGGLITVGAGGATFDFPAGMFQFSGNASLDGEAISNLGEIAFADRPNFDLTIDNAGKLINRGQIDFGAAGRINNLPGGVIEIAKVGAGGVTNGGAPIPGIFNSGTIRLTEAGISTVTVPFSNLSGGIIEVATGTLALHSPGTWEGASFLINTGSEVTLNASDRTWTGTYTGSGGGILRLGGGSQGIGAGGTITVGAAGATVNFPVGFFHFSGNASLTGGTLTNLGDITMTDRPNLGLTIDNAGTLLSFAGIDFSDTGRINNLAGATFTIGNLANSTFAGGPAASPGIFNAGTLVLASSANVATGLPFSNTGLVQVTTGTLRFTGAIAQIVDSELTDGTWEVFDGASLLITRTFATNSADLIQHGTGVIGGVGANLTTNAGSIQLLDGAGLTLTRAFTNSGSVVVGAASVLTTASDLTQSTSGRLAFELGGSPDSGQFGRLAVGGVAALNGTVNFTLANGFVPEIGQSFPLATFASRSGTFSEFEGTRISRDLFLSPALTDASLVVNAVTAPVNAKIANQKSVVTFTDADGDTIRVTMKGPGSAQVSLVGDVPDNADIAFIAVDGATAKTRLKVAALFQSSGDGFANVGSVFVAGTSLRSIQIKGDLELLDATNVDLGKVTVTGQLGRILAGDGDPQKPAVKKLIVGSLGTTESVVDPLLSEINGSLLKLKVKRDVVGAAMDVLGSLRNTSIGGDLIGQIDTGAVLLASIFERGFVDPRVTGGLPFGALNAESVGRFKVAGNVDGGSVTSGGDIGSVSIGQDLHAGGVAAGGQIKNVKVLGAMNGDDPAHPSVIAALARVGSTKPTEAVAIDALLVKGDVTNSQVLLGYRKDPSAFSRPLLPANSDASAGKVTVKGDWSASSLVAGVFDATGDGFGLNDTTIPGDTTQDIVARIASVVIKGTATGSADPGEQYAITTQKVGKLSINGQQIPLSKDAQDVIPLDPVNGNFSLVEVAGPLSSNQQSDGSQRRFT